MSLAADRHMPAHANAMVVLDPRGDLLGCVERVLGAHGLSPLRATSVREACDLLIAFRQTQTLVSHLIVDLELPDGPGELVLDAAMAAFPHTRIVTLAEVLTAQRACSLVGRSTHLPRSGLTAEALVDVLLRHPDRGIEAFASALSLSKREFSVLLCIIEGLSIADMAARLNCKISTVKTYTQRIYNKAQRSSQTELLGLLVSWLTTPSFELLAVVKRSKRNAA
jgi:DNA-binding NarL/FixJ family response regulator